MLTRLAYNGTETRYVADHGSITLYNNEAGSMIDSDAWTICEKPDYPSEDHLIEASIIHISPSKIPPK